MATLFTRLSGEAEQRRGHCGQGREEKKIDQDEAFNASHQAFGLARDHKSSRTDLTPARGRRGMCCCTG